MTVRHSQSTRRQTSRIMSTESPLDESTTAIEVPTSQENGNEPKPNWWQDRYSILLLVALYAAQGLPMGLAFGSIPFLLKERGASYVDLAHFSFASLPYSLKLFVAPIVDSFYNPTFGRRKSWIVPIQYIIATICLIFSTYIQKWVQLKNVSALMPTSLVLIAMAALQDIAVDGWSLTLLSKQNVSYASTCQSLGLSIGYFATFTIFLALSNESFSNNWIRPYLFTSKTGPITDLRLTLQAAALYYIILTSYVAFFKREAPDDNSKKTDDNSTSNQIHTNNNALPQHQPTSTDSSTNFSQSPRSNIFESISSTYRDLFVAIRQPAVQKLVACLLIAKVGFSAYDYVSPLKLLELGFSKESMASMAVIQTPFTLIGTIFTGKWAAKKSPMSVYLVGFLSRFIISLTGPPCIRYFAAQGGVVTPAFYALILTISILYSLAAECLMFVGMGAFFLNVTSSSVHVAGSYLTLLNTSSNMGGIWHKALILWLVDKLTFRTSCEIPTNAPIDFKCPIQYDGYYILSFALLPIAITVGMYFLRTLPKLQKLPDSAWRASRS